MLWWIMVIVVLGLIWLSVRQRILLIHAARRQGVEQEVSSPAAEAIKGLVGVAGGVYVALVSLAGFLQMPLPGPVSVVGMTFDPLAMAALLVAIVQPFFVR